MANNYPGVYTGLVEDNRDPEKLGRVKVRVPIVYGSPSDISTAQLPWAMSRGLPAGGSNASGGMDWVPEVGDIVWVTFLDNEPEKPLWEWATQSQLQALRLKLHKYDSLTGKPNRAALTRYGHTVEINEESVLLVTAKGNTILLDDLSNGAILRTNQDFLLSVQDLVAMIAALQLSATGQIFFKTAKGFSVQATDMAVSCTEDLIQKVGRYTLLVGSALFTIIDGAIALIDKSGSTITSDGSGNVAVTTASGTHISLSAAQIDIATADKNTISIGKNGIAITAANVTINGGNIALGASARTPVVLTDLLLTVFNSHTHTNGNNGSPTGPPIVPLLPQMIGSTTTLAQ